MKNVAVFFGGVSVEHDVSVITGVLTVNSLDKTLFSPVPVYVDGDGLWYSGDELKDIDNYKNLNLKKLMRVTLCPGDGTLYRIRKNKLIPLCTLAAVINCMHGERGEDGSLAGLVNMCGVPFASPSVAASSVGMDKAVTKRFLKGMGVKTLPCAVIKKLSDCAEAAKKIGFPLIVKPACLGSSIGISRADNMEELEQAVHFAFRFGDKAVAEKLLSGFTEINCAAYASVSGGIVVSECERPVGAGEILSFEDKYTSGKREFPADIDDKVSDKIRAVTERIYRELDCVGPVRADFMLSDGQVYLNEINTVPGSLSYYLFCNTLKDFSKILTQTIAVAEKKFAVQSTLQKTFKSSVLNLGGAKSSKRL